MTAVRVVSAYRDGEATIATVELDNALTVSGVRVEASPYTGRPVANPPRRRNGSRILGWSEYTADAIAAAVLGALPAETVAVVEELPFTDAEPVDTDTCPLCAGRWLTCGCDPAAALAAWEEAGGAA